MNWMLGHLLVAFLLFTLALTQPNLAKIPPDALFRLGQLHPPTALSLLRVSNELSANVRLAFPLLSAENASRNRFFSVCGPLLAGRFLRALWRVHDQRVHAPFLMEHCPAVLDGSARVLLALDSPLTDRCVDLMLRQWEVMGTPMITLHLSVTSNMIEEDDDERRSVYQMARLGRLIPFTLKIVGNAMDIRTHWVQTLLSDHTVQLVGLDCPGIITTHIASHPHLRCLKTFGIPSNLNSILSTSPGQLLALSLHFEVYSLRRLLNKVLIRNYAHLQTLQLYLDGLAELEKSTLRLVGKLTSLTSLSLAACNMGTLLVAISEQFKTLPQLRHLSLSDPNVRALVPTIDILTAMGLPFELSSLSLSGFRLVDERSLVQFLDWLNTSKLQLLSFHNVSIQDEQLQTLLFGIRRDSQITNLALHNVGLSSANIPILAVLSARQLCSIQLTAEKLDENDLTLFLEEFAFWNRDRRSHLEVAVFKWGLQSHIMDYNSALLMNRFGNIPSVLVS